MTVSALNTLPSLSCAMATPNSPIVVPAMSASLNPSRPPDSSATRDTSTTATTAITMPASTTGPGTPSVAKPATTGMTAARTPVTGATIPIRPIASPR
jgi:hypothetical protein